VTADPSRLDDRVADLERRLDRMDRILRDVVDAMRRRAIEVPQPGSPLPTRPESLMPPPAPAPAGLKSPEARQPTPRPASDVVAAALAGKGSAWWLSRAGIGLLLFGVAFLFKYAVDQGWLTPWIRVAFGLAVGFVLAIIGLRVRASRRWFGAVLLGGASATFYITGFAAFQLLVLVTYPTALTFMVAVTVYTMWAAWHTDDAILSVLGALGGLGTPFLLYTGTGAVADLATYESVVLLGIAGIYRKKGWDALLWTSVVGGWGVVLIGLDQLARLRAYRSDQWMLQVAVLVAVATLWAVPVWRARAVQPARRNYFPAALGLVTPVIAFFVSNEIWRWTRAWGAVVAAAAALLWTATWWWLRRDARGNSALASMHAVAAAALLGLALQYLFTDHVLVLALAVELVGLHYIARETHDRFICVAGHWLALAIIVLLIAQLAAPGRAAIPVVSWRGAAQLAVLLLGLVAARTLSQPQEVAVYRLGVHLLFLAWLLSELSRLPGGQAWVSVAWGVYAAALLVAGLRLDRVELRTTALATLALVVAKLFLVDLAKLQAIWRVLLFMGFGAAFLALSYYFPSLWKAKRSGAEPPAPC
jgi:hypothetical protein